MKRVVVGLSGGVDSSVAAYQLIQEGYEVIGMFMRNWHDESVTLSDECPWIDDSNDALLIANQLGIPFQVIDLSAEYKERIIDYMFTAYENGTTPNPDVLCNREIKFDVFLKAAMDLGADYVATGHYCRKKTNEDGTFSLLAGIDKTKDQSYFLCQIRQEQLAKALFPIGNLEKSAVREIAKKLNLVTADKKDSQGLCFVGKISLPEFLQQKLKAKIGDVLEVAPSEEQFKTYDAIPPILDNVVSLSRAFNYDPKMGIKVAEHQGAHFYTIGQRKGLHVGGRPLPSFVIATDTENNLVYTGQTEHHPGLNKYALKLEASSINWLRPELKFNLENGVLFDVRIRYRQALRPAVLIKREEGYFLFFSEKEKGITPGQFAAWYQDDDLIGSAAIMH
jgi:tRNA-specific 2-thiouridylase